jgi:hypothetical protein
MPQSQSSERECKENRAYLHIKEICRVKQLSRVCNKALDVALVNI